MARSGPIISVEDDEDDQFMIGQAMQAVGVTNPLRYFPNGLAALHYLETTDEKPFLILSDINMPLMTGLELYAQINQRSELRRKAIPFVFFTTADYSETIHTAIGGLVQGFYRKPTRFDDLCQLLKVIIAYCQLCP